MYKNNLQTDFICIICNKIFPRPDRCQRHIYKSHKNDERKEEAAESCKQQKMFIPMKTFLVASKGEASEILQIFSSFCGLSRRNLAF